MEAESSLLQSPEFGSNFDWLEKCKDSQTESSVFVSFPKLSKGPIPLYKEFPEIIALIEEMLITMGLPLIHGDERTN